MWFARFNVRTVRINEKFIFNKVYYQLYDLYKKRYEKENENYLEKKKLINEKYSIKQIMEYLEIRPKFRCLDEYEAFNELVAFWFITCTASKKIAFILDCLTNE